MRYLALDQAARTTGYAIYEGDKLIQYGKFNLSPSKPIEQRLQTIIQKLTEIANDYDIQEVFFEDIQYQNNIKTYKILAYIQAAILIWCYNNNYKFAILTPSHWRKIIANDYGLKFSRTRTEQKNEAIQFCKEYMSVDVSSDEADAICLGKAALIEKNKNKSAF